MTTKTEDNDNYIYAIAGRLDVQSRLLAKKLHEARHIYVVDGMLDGLNISYGALKSFFDIAYSDSKTSASDALHDWTLTPGGMVVAATQSIALISFAMLANYCKDSDKDLIRSYIALTWPYLRDSLKGLKNGYKGVKSTIQLANILGGNNLNFLILPLGIALSGLSILNRIWMRHLINIRKELMKANEELLASLALQDTLTAEECKEIRKKIKQQVEDIKNKHRLAFLSATYGGLIDSLYLYMGVLSLCPLNGPLLIAMAVFCVIYSVACVLTRVYDEYDYQRKLKITQAKIDLSVYLKKYNHTLQADFARLQGISVAIARGNKSKELQEEQDSLAKSITEKITKFRTKRDHLKSLTTLSPFYAFLEGMRQGLAAYGALASVMFSISTIIVFTSVVFPPALLVSCISIGMAFLIGFIAYSTYKHYKHSVSDEVINDKPYEQLQDMLRDLKHIYKPNDLDMLEKQPAAETRDFKTEVKVIIKDGEKIADAPEFTFLLWFETIRCFFSGPGKGTKVVDYTFNPLQELAKDGHYHETPLMIGLSIVASIVYSFILALRAYARGFSRLPTPDSKHDANNEDNIGLNPELIVQEKINSSANAIAITKELVDDKEDIITPPAASLSALPAQSDVQYSNFELDTQVMAQKDISEQLLQEKPAEESVQTNDVVEQRLNERARLTTTRLSTSPFSLFSNIAPVSPSPIPLAIVCPS